MSKKIKLTQRLPVEPRHGMAEGNIYEVTKPVAKRGYVVTSAASGEEVLVLFRECVVLEKDS